VYSYAHLTDCERYVWSFAFSGSRHIPLFEAIFQPFLAAAAGGDPQAVAEARALIWDPEHAFRRDGPLHTTFIKYRASGKQLHTTSYIARPQKGQSGEEYTVFIMEQTVIT
jgi:hypothetical protein